MAKLIYKPFGVAAGVVGGVLAGRVFKRIWGLVAREADPPSATDRDKRWREVVAAAAIQGAVFGAVKAVIDRGGASAFERVTGSWPGTNSGKTTR